MSRATKRKHVMLEVLQDDFSLPTENQQVARIISSRGNNLHEVEDGIDGTTYLVSMPTKFRKNIWVKRGDFVLIEPIEEGDKVKAEIVKILTHEHAKYFKKEKVWPARFLDQKNDEGAEAELFVNTNRRNVVEDDDSEGSGDSDSNDDSEEDNTDADDESSCVGQSGDAKI